MTWGRAMLLAALAAGPGAAEAPAMLDLAAWAAGLPESFHVSGLKSEPTYQLQTDIARHGDVFAILGGAPAHATRALVRVRTDPAGGLQALPCPVGATCGTARGAPGHLATAALVAAARAGQLTGAAPVLPYGPHRVVCLPAEVLGVVEPILDPCFETTTGAAIAQRHRTSARFDGPSLDPQSISLRLGLAELPPDLSLHP